MGYITVISAGFNSGVQVVSVSDAEPTQNDLATHWNNLSLRRVDTKFGAVSDLIEVYEDKQISKVFLNIPSEIYIGMTLTPNPESIEDAIGHYAK
jgi:hypothetical protein